MLRKYEKAGAVQSGREDFQMEKRLQGEYWPVPKAKKFSFKTEPSVFASKVGCFQIQNWVSNVY